MELITGKLVELGVPGLVIAALLVWLYRLQDRIDKVQDERLREKSEHLKMVQELQAKHVMELAKEHDERLEDQKEYTKTAIELHSSIHQTIAKVSEVFDYVYKQDRPSKHD